MAHVVGTQRIAAANEPEAVAAPLPVTSSTADLTLSGPATWDLSRQEEIALRLQAGVGVDVQHLHVFSNVGVVSLSPLSPTSADIVVRLSGKKFPQVVLVGVYDDQRRVFLWRRIAAAARPTLEVHSEPQLEVQVIVEPTHLYEERKYQVKTGAQGNAEVRLLLPPGVAEVTMHAEDAHGNAEDEMIAIDTPAFPLLMPVCLPQERKVVVVSTDPRGMPADLSALQFSADLLSFGDLKQLGAGVLEVAYEVDPSFTGRRDVETYVRLGNQQQSCRTQVVVLPPVGEVRVSGRVEPAFAGGLLLGVRTESVWNFARVAGVGAAVDFELPLRDRYGGGAIGLHAGAIFGLAHNTLTDTEDELRVSVGRYPLLVAARYLVPLGAWGVEGFARGGASLFAQRTTLFSTTQTKRAVVPQLGAGLGVFRHLIGWSIGLNLGFDYAPVSEAWVKGNAAGARASLGLRRQL